MSPISHAIENPTSQPTPGAVISSGTNDGAPGAGETLRARGVWRVPPWIRGS